MSKNNVRVTVYPKDQDFQISVGARHLTSRSYANSSNAYRGARSAMRNLASGNITNESNYGPEVLAITNVNGFVIAANEQNSARTAAKAASDVYVKTRGVKVKNMIFEAAEQ